MVDWFGQLYLGVMFLNEKFLSVNKDKQDVIVNAAFEIFSKSDYRHSTVENIARKAGVSKGLLFHYFESKKDLYLYIYDYGIKFIKDEMGKKFDWTETDFFKILIKSQDLKCEIMKRYNNIFEFLIKAYYEDNEEVAGRVMNQNLQLIEKNINAVLQKADLSKFKENTEPERVLYMIIWCADGMMRNRMPSTDIDSINDEFKEILNMIREKFYREEYLDGNN